MKLVFWAQFVFVFAAWAFWPATWNFGYLVLTLIIMLETALVLLMDQIDQFRTYRAAKHRSSERP